MIVSSNIRYIAQDGTLTLQGVQLFRDMVRTLEAQSAKLAAIAAVVEPTGGATVDDEARAAIAAIIAGAA